MSTPSQDRPWDADGGSGPFMPNSPDPTKLTQDAVDRASSVFRRELAFIQDLLSTRLDAQSAASDQRLANLTTSVTQEHAERINAVSGLRELVEFRFADLEKAADRRFLAAERVPGQVKAELTDQLTGFRDNIDIRLDAMDKATALLAGNALRQQETLREEMLTKAQALRELVEQRLDLMDIAARVLAMSVEKVPTDVDRAVGNMREVVVGEIERVQSVTEEKFTAIDRTFSSNALALTAALAAQKEAAAEQNKSNTLAITKSESSTKETIAANAVQAGTGLASLENQFDDLKERVVRIESLGVGASTHKSEARADAVQQHGSIQLGIAAFAGIIALISVAVSIIIATRH